MRRYRNSLSHSSCALLTLATLWHPSAAHAWGRDGHELAGAVAAHYLSESAARRAAELLEGESLATAGHWADRMRDDPSPFWQEVAGPWHYVTVPPGRRYDAALAPAEGDAVTALREFTRILADPDSPVARQQLALRFGLHIVQDLHQPLHVGNGRDRGGNDIALEVRGESSNLHRLWDRGIIDSAGRSRQGWLHALDERELLRPPVGADNDPLLWIGESIRLRDSIYPPPQRVDAQLLSRYLPTVEEQLALAGIRSAAWLNAVLTPAAPPAARPQGPSWWRRLFGNRK